MPQAKFREWVPAEDTYSVSVLETHLKSGLLALFDIFFGNLEQ